MKEYKKVSRRKVSKKVSRRKVSKKVSRRKSYKKVSRKSSKKVSRKSSKKVSRRKSSKKASRRPSKKPSKKVSRKSSKKVSRKASKKVSRKSSKKASRRKASKKVSRKSSKKVSRKASKKVSRKSSKKVSRKPSEKKYKKDIPMPLPVFGRRKSNKRLPYVASKVFDYKTTPTGFKLPKAKTAISAGKFTGNAFHSLVSMLYFSKKHENTCLVIPPKTLFKKISNEDAYYDTDIFYKDSLSIKSGFIDVFKTCKKRFILFPVSVFAKVGGAHANMMIYDTKTRELERFDPHGRLSARDDLVNAFSSFDSDIQTELKYNGIEISTYSTPLDFCPSLSFQKLEEADKAILNDPGGFCQAWSEWYADLRLSNPDSSRDEVVQIAVRKIKQDPKGFKSFIRSYANFVSEMGEEFRKSNFDTKIFDKYVI